MQEKCKTSFYTRWVIKQMSKYVGSPISIVILLESVKDLNVKLYIHQNQQDK